MHSRLRCSARRARAAGGVLPLVLMMLSLAALLTSAGLERATDRSLLARAATERNRLHEAAATALAAGIRDAKTRVCPDDFAADKDGRYAEARATRWGKKHYPWEKDVDVDPGEDGGAAGFIIEQLAHHAGGARCRLLVTAAARAAAGDELRGQALFSLPQETRDAVRIFAPLPPSP